MSRAQDQPPERVRRSPTQRDKPWEIYGWSRRSHGHRQTEKGRRCYLTPYTFNAIATKLYIRIGLEVSLPYSCCRFTGLCYFLFTQRSNENPPWLLYILCCSPLLVMLPFQTRLSFFYLNFNLASYQQQNAFCGYSTRLARVSPVDLRS